MIDLHCHILPGIDDGPAGMEETVEMCRLAAQDGIRTIVATPHFRPGRYEPDAVLVRTTIEAVREALIRQKVDVNILPGADVTVTPELHDNLAQNPFLTINGQGKYFLAEFPHDTVPPRWDGFLNVCIRRGIIPILTHPERNRWFLGHPDALYEFVRARGMVQLTAMSVTGANGRVIQDYCKYLLGDRLVHIIASDAHSSSDRKPILSEAVRSAEQIIGKEAARDLVQTYPEAVISGIPIDPPEPLFHSKSLKRKAWHAKITDLWRI